MLQLDCKSLLHMAIRVCNVLLFQARAAYDPSTCSVGKINDHDDDFDHEVSAGKAIIKVKSTHDDYYE